MPLDLSVSGAMSATIRDTPQVTMTGVEHPPQIEGVPADADLVTITAVMAAIADPLAESLGAPWQHRLHQSGTLHKPYKCPRMT